MNINKIGNMDTNKISQCFVNALTNMSFRKILVYSLTLLILSLFGYIVLIISIIVILTIETINEINKPRVKKSRCKHKFKVVDVKDDTPGIDRFLLGPWRRKLIINKCEKCDKLIYEKEQA